MEVGSRTELFIYGDMEALFPEFFLNMTFEYVDVDAFIQ